MNITVVMITRMKQNSPCISRWDNMLNLSSIQISDIQPSYRHTNTRSSIPCAITLDKWKVIKLQGDGRLGITGCKCRGSKRLVIREPDRLMDFERHDIVFHGSSFLGYAGRPLKVTAG